MPAKNILRKKSDFDNLYKRGRSVGDRYVVVFYRRNGFEYNRVAYLASKKVGNSVCRNRARRLLRESYHLSKNDCDVGYDIIFIARNSINGKKCGDVTASMRSALIKTGIIKKK